jgi:serine/threonine protein kinase
MSCVAGFFYQNSEEVNRVRWLRLLFLLCDALRSYRTLDIAHRDLKPNNIAVDFTETTFYITVRPPVLPSQMLILRMQTYSTSLVYNV